MPQYILLADLVIFISIRQGGGASGRSPLGQEGPKVYEKEKHPETNRGEHDHGK